MALKKSFLGTVSTDVASHEWLREVLGDRETEDVSSLILAIDLLLNEDSKEITDCGLTIIEHGQALVLLGVKFKLDILSLTALMLYPAFINDIFNQDRLDAVFSEHVIQLLESTRRLTELEKLWSKSNNLKNIQVDAMRRLLLAMVNDSRSVVLRLVIQLCAMYHLENIKTIDNKYLANMSKYLYAPLANRLGLSQLKWQLEDLSFKELNSVEYRQISQAINEKRDLRQRKVGDTIKLLKTLCVNIKFEISGRVKHFYGIYKKIQKKHIDINEVYDVLAVRIIVETIEDCYNVLGIVHENFEPIKQEFDDYIAAPKENGYQSIHTAVKINSYIVEVQIRTQDMHKFADSGAASHWLYKEGGTRDNVADKVSWLNQLVLWQEDVGKEVDCFSNRVFVFTPKGEVKDLPKGSTPLDFAYSIHTQVGHSCRGAKVNGKIVALSTPLTNADRVQIITGKQIEPVASWLTASPKVLCTNFARMKVESWFRKQDKEIMLEKAKFMLDKGGKISNADLLKVAKKLTYNCIDDLLLAIARHDITVALVFKTLESLNEVGGNALVKNDELLERSKKTIRQHVLDVPVCVEGLSGILVTLAKCCSPILGDRIIGRVSKLKGVVVHNENCQQIKDYAINPDRFLNVNWYANNNSKFITNIKIEITDIVVSQVIQNWLVQNDITWTSCSYVHKNGQSQVTMKIKVVINGQAELNKLLTGVNNLAGVINVARL